MTSITRSADAKGRITLPKEYANSLVVIEQINDTELRIKKAKAIPEKELWLWQNPSAIGMVLQGLAQAENKDFVEGPDLDADAKLFEEK